MVKFKEFLEYASEGLAVAASVVYCSSRLLLGVGFCAIDVAFVLMLAAWLWSRGYAEYLEHELMDVRKRVDERSGG